jgi:hypothetical protein
MWIRCIRAGTRIAYTGQQTCRYGKHRESLSANGVAMAVATARVFEKHRDWEAVPKRLGKACAADAWRTAARMVIRQDPRSAQRFLRNSLRHRLCAPRTWLYLIGACVLAGR